MSSEGSGASTILMAVFVACMLPSLLRAQALPVGTEFQVNTSTYNEQASPGVAIAGNGDFLVVWATCAGLFCTGILGQRYGSNGVALGSEFQVHSYTTWMRTPRVVGVSNGGFVVVWASFHDGFTYGIFGRRYDSTGTAVSTEFQVNTFTTHEQRYPNLALTENGDFVVVWQSRLQDLSGAGIFGQRYASDGSALGSEFQVNTYSTHYQEYPSVAAASDGSFLVVWQSRLQDGDNHGVFGRRYTSNGSALGSEFQVNTYTTSLQGLPSVAAAPSTGDFVVVWKSLGQDGSDQGIFAQRYGSNGSALGTEFQTNSSTTGSQHNAAVAADGDGNFVIVWTGSDDGDFVGVFSREFKSDGSPLGTEFQVNTYTTSYQGTVDVAARINGDFVVTWRSYAQDGSRGGIFAQRYAQPAPVPPTACAATPQEGCASPGKSLLLIADKNEDGAGPNDKLIWKWLKGPLTTQAEFGDPVSSAAYHFCVYTGTAQDLVIEASVPAGGTCAGSPCWKAISSKGYKRKEPAASTTGIAQILLKGGAAGAAKVLVKGKNGNLDVTSTTLPLDDSADVIAQVSNSDNTNCWQGTFPSGSITKNTEAQFKAKVP